MNHISLMQNTLLKMLRKNLLTESGNFRSSHFLAKAPKNSKNQFQHTPVMLNEVLDNLALILDLQTNPVVVDMTFGCGGHSQAILNRWPHARLYCLDRDPTAYQRCKSLNDDRISPLLGCFRNLPTLIPRPFDANVDAVLFDLGVSSPQFDDASRGFALSVDGPLDMRMDGDSYELPSAADIVNQLPLGDLAKVIKTYGEERYSNEIARAIVDYRNSVGPITRTGQLASLIEANISNYSNKKFQDKMGRYAHPATRTFQALRIFVNDELNDLFLGLEAAHQVLKSRGRCLVISFHSLEDRIVKRVFQTAKVKPPVGVDELGLHVKLRSSVEPLSEAQMKAMVERKWHAVGKSKLSGSNNNQNVIAPSQNEIESNPRARSAKLRVAEKLSF